MIRKACLVIAVVMLLGLAVPTQAQTPTPIPTPTPEIVHGESGDFMVLAEISYGQAGVIVALVFVAGLQLAEIMLRVAEWLRRY